MFYEYSIPYAGGATLSINNTLAEPVVLQNITFVVNTKIKEDPWGNLWAWGATLDVQPNPDGVTTTYTIREPQGGVTIPGNGQGNLSFTCSGFDGPLEVAMNPQKVSVQLADGSSQNISIADHCRGNDCNDPVPDKNLAVYYTDWSMYQRQFPATKLPVGYFNNVLYAFINYDAKGNISLYDPNADCQQLPTISMLRQRYPYMNALLSFGGWTLSEDFSALAADETARHNFVQNICQALVETGFNGVDIDWEYPSENDATNFAKLLTDLRNGLNQLGKNYKLTIAAPAGIDKIQAITNGDKNAWSQIFAAVDYVDVMSYDYHGAWDQISDTMSPMSISPGDPYYPDPTLRQYNAKETIATYQKLGCPNKKIVMGVPAYGRTMMVAADGNNHGLWQQITGTPPGQYDDTGVYDYKCIRTNACNGGKELPAGMKFLQPEQYQSGNYSETPIGYDSSGKMFLTFDDDKSAAGKAEFVQSEQLGGAMLWESSGDVSPTQNGSILGAIYDVFKTPQLPDYTSLATISSPDTQFSSASSYANPGLTANIALGCVLYNIGKSLCSLFMGGKKWEKPEATNTEQSSIRNLWSFWQSFKKSDGRKTDAEPDFTAPKAHI